MMLLLRSRFPRVNLAYPLTKICRYTTFVFLALSALPSYAQPFQPVPDRAESAIFPVQAGEDSSPLKHRRADAAPPPYSISIGNLSQEEKSAETGAVSRPGTPHKIGSGRDIPQLASTANTAASLYWQDTPQGGKIAAISIASPQAAGIRLGILVHRLPAEATLRFYSQGSEVAYEISGKEIMASLQRNLDAGDNSDAARTYWSPHVEGEEATLEIELPLGISPDTLEIAIPSISHFFFSPFPDTQRGNVAKIGQAGKAASCELDVSCYGDWSPESNATAKMTFVDSGSSYVCSGTLLNDTASSKTPYFLSANHCISSQTVASTLQTYWFYRSMACNNGTLNPGYQTRTGGATLLYTSTTTDTSFMQLGSSPPAGAMYAGWYPNAPELGASVTAIHHPGGDLQKISFGSFQSFLDCSALDKTSHAFTCSDTIQANGKFLNVSYTSGTTEGGSSGSGLFTTIGNSHYLIGQLRGGSSGCSAGGTDEFGRFDIAYNDKLYHWLNNAGSVFSLSVSNSGNGSGLVTSSPGGINCGTACIVPFDKGTSVILTATPAPGSIFTGWSGACSGTSTSCSVAMTAVNSVTATFSTALSTGVDIKNYFPFQPGYEWTYQDDASGSVTSYKRTVAPDTAIIDGYPAFVWTDSKGISRYMTNDANGVRRHASAYSTGTGNGVNTDTYNPPEIYSPASVVIGNSFSQSGTLTSTNANTGSSGTTLFNESSTIGFESVTVPLGTFSAIRFNTNRSFDGGLATQSTMWVADGVGIVKMANNNSDGTVEIFSLTGINFIPNAGGEVSTGTSANYQNLWWNPNESGWGISVTQHSNMIFSALYTYDQAGQPAWYVMSSCPVSANGCTGEIYKVSGGTLPTVPWNGAGKTVSSAGTGTLTFTDANNGTFDYVLNGISGSKSIIRQIFATGTAPPAVNYSDLWWNASESGWGVAISQQYAMIFAAWYVYDATGKATWYVASSCPVIGNGCTGDIYKVTGGSPVTSVWNGSNKVVTKAGSVTFAFTDANNGTMNYSINGVIGNRAISRQPF